MKEHTRDHGSLLIHDFVHPWEVLNEKNLSADQKRAILSLWASDACAVESRPGFRWMPGTPGPILFDHVMQALLALDSEADWSSHAAKSGGEKIARARELA
ncbi:MAG: hypothetical protein J0I19_07565 [Alphaproteobacteria bacterium]|nr:hypothetical protein [Alphaproteobacteria bacterium]